MGNKQSIIDKFIDAGMSPEKAHEAYVKQMREWGRKGAVNGAKTRPKSSYSFSNKDLASWAGSKRKNWNK